MQHEQVNALKRYPGEPTPEQIESQELYREVGLNKDEFGLICKFLKRKPNWTELGIYSVMWSEHCSYKNSKPLLKKFPTRGPRVIQGPGEGAGVIDIGDQQAVVFKIESHNHPSAIEPFQGAATGVGGIIRDVFSMGARPIALLNSLRFGSLETPRGKYLFNRVVEGIAHYGNGIGIPTVGGEVSIDNTYDENPLVNAMCVGILDHKDVQKGVAKGVGNPVIYVGASTGRDGIHGATFASEELSNESEKKRSAVQVGDPFMEKRILEACLEMVERDILIGIQDMGAAGLTCSSAEMAAKGNTGMELYMDRVPQRESDMTPYEILLSESQERMLLVVEDGREDEIFDICHKWGVQAAIVGRVTQGDRYRIYDKEELVADIPVQTLVNDAPVYVREKKVPSYYLENQNKETKIELADEEIVGALHGLMQSVNIASKKSIYKQFDHHVGSRTAVAPGSDAAVVLIQGTQKALAMAIDGNSRYVYLDPKTGGKIAVAESARNVVCSGAEPIGMTDCLNFGNPEKSEIYWQLSEAVEGVSEACRHLRTPVVGGNVSLYNESLGTAIYPTPIVGMVGLIEKKEQITKQEFCDPGDSIFLLGETYAEFGGSELQVWKYGKVFGLPPQLDLEKEKKLQQVILTAIRSGIVKSAHDLADGGLAVAIAEGCICGKKGAAIDCQSDLDVTAFLFSESQSRAILTVEQEQGEKLVKIAQQIGVPITNIGIVTAEEFLRITVNGKDVVTESIEKLTRLWEEAIPCKRSPSLMN